MTAYGSVTFEEAMNHCRPAVRTRRAAALALGAVGVVIFGRETRGRPMQETIHAVDQSDDAVLVGEPADPAEAPASGLVRRPAAWARLARLRVASSPNCQGGY
jgi:hypothetical protein